MYGTVTEESGECFGAGRYGALFAGCSLYKPW